MRKDIAFDAEGVTLRGWHYRPESAEGPRPTIVMAHGFSAVKEMYLDRFAEAFAKAGLGALVFDNRNFG
ncbi:MAG TPA: acetylxylan esterase, partial [Alphaproteobacteria bacterium]|nr:acetylxylan esterase [Alphaproteobacteria bacterium]